MRGPDAAAMLPLSGQPCSGYTLIGSPENDAGADFQALLIDMEGRVVQRWTITGFPPKMLPGGSLIGCGGVFTGSYDCIEMQQVTWDGEVSWAFSDWATTEEGGRAARHHHDFLREGNPVGYYAPGLVPLTSGSTLVLAHERVADPAFRAGLVDDDVIYEVDAAGALTSVLWRGREHLEEFGFDQAALDDLREREPEVPYFEWLHGNSISRLGPNRHFDAGLSAFAPDNILYSSRSANLVLILDAETGAVVWRIGPEFAGRPEAELGQFIGQHMPHLVPQGLPGEGNVLVFDNGSFGGYGGERASGSPNRHERGFSRVLEFDPVTLQKVWEYPGPGDESFYSGWVGNATRLPNGNTLITIGIPGRIIEVTPDRRIVWEYQYTPDSSGRNAAWVYRSYRVPPEWLPEGVNAQWGNYPTWHELFE